MPDSLTKQRKSLPEFQIFGLTPLHELTGVNDGCMIAAECITNDRKGLVCHRTGQEHSHLTGPGDVLRTLWTHQIAQADIKVLGHRLLNPFDNDGVFLLLI